MMTPKTIRSVPIGALRTDDVSNIIVFKHVYCIIVWRDNKIAWYDQYTMKGGLYLGIIKTLRYLEEANETMRKAI